MAKKKKSKDGPKKLKDTARDTARKVWLAGLGALAVAESEGGKLFGDLVERGEKLEKRSKPLLDKLTAKASDARKEAESRAAKVGDEARASWAKVETIVDESVTTTMHRLGIPTRKEIEALTKRVEALTKKLDEQKKPRRKPAKKAARKAPARKPATKAAPAAAPATPAPATTA